MRPNSKKTKAGEKEGDGSRWFDSDEIIIVCGALPIVLTASVSPDTAAFIEAFADCELGAQWQSVRPDVMTNV